MRYRYPGGSAQLKPESLMSSKFAPRGALWLTGGLLATALGVIVNEVFQQRVVAVLAGAIFAVVFGMAIERIVAALNRAARSSPSESTDPIAEGGQHSTRGDVPEHMERLAKRQHHD